MTSPTPPTTQLDPSLPIAQRGGAWGYVPDEAFQQMHEQLFGKAGDGSPLGALLDSFGEQAGFDARMVLASGIANGVNPKALASQLAQVLETSRSRAQTIARTEMLRSYRDAQILNYRANSDVVNGWMWSADGANCCAACMYMDGTAHTNDEWMDSHCNCRCVPLPITKSWADILEPLGIDYSDIPDTSIDITYESALERFMQASAQFQRSILGPAKWEAWMRGDLQISDLVGVKSDAKWGDSIYEKSLKELGLNANDYLAAPIPADADTVPYYREAGTRKWVRLDELPPNDGFAYYREPGSAKWVRVDGERAALDRIDPARVNPAKASRVDMGLGRTKGFYRQTIDGRDYFIKEVPPSSVVGYDPIAASRAADSAAQILDMGDLVIPTRVIANADGTFAVSPWVDGTDLSTLSVQDLAHVIGTLPREDVQRLSLFEYLVGDEDRASGQYFLMRDGTIRALDFEGAFGREMTGWGNNLLSVAFPDDFAAQSIDRQIIQDLLADANRVRAAAERDGVSQEALDAFDARVAKLSRAADMNDPRVYDLLDDSAKRYYADPPRLDATYTEHQSAISARSGTYPDGREWRVREYTGPTPPSETEANGMAGLGRADGETWTPKWDNTIRDDRWIDANPRFAGTDSQCTNCYRIFGGPHEGEYLDHMVWGSHGPCPECYAVQYFERMVTRLGRAYPDLTGDEIAQAARTFMERIPDPLAALVRLGDNQAWIEYSQQVEREAVEAARGAGGAPGGAVERPSALPGPMSSADAEAMLTRVQDRLVGALDQYSESESAEATKARVSHEVVERAEKAGNVRRKDLDALARDFGIPLGKADAARYDELGSRVLEWWADTGHESTGGIGGRLLQRAVADEFRISGAALDHLSISDRALLRKMDDLYAKHGQALRGLMRAMYENTQGWLREQGITEVWAYRAMAWEQGAEPPTGVVFDNEMRVLSVRMQPASSYSVSLDEAVRFATMSGDGSRVMVIAERIPADQILATAQTGIGSKLEAEIAVKGGERTGYTLAWDLDTTRPLTGTLDGQITNEFRSDLADRLAGGGGERPSALPSSDAFATKVADTLGKDTASEWSDALGETGQLQGPIAERSEALSWEPRAVSKDVSAALREQLESVHVNLDELHPAAANQFAQTLQVLRADFPEVAEYLEYIGQTGKDWSRLYPESTLGRSRTAMAASNGQGIGFNRYFWSTAKTDLADLTALLRDQVEQGWFFDGYGSPGATLAHEFGHSTYQWAMKQGGEIRQLVMDYVGQWGEKQPGFSAYAAVDHHELFAEAFSARYFGTAAVLDDPMVADMGRLLEDIRAALGRTSTADRAGVAETRAAGEMPTRLRELPPGTAKDGVQRMRYEQWRMTQENEPVVMVFDANRAPLFADRMGETMRATQLSAEQQAIADTASARGPLKVSLWKPEGDGLTAAELRWAVERGANEIQVLTPNGVDVLRAPRGPRVGGAWTPQWVRETVMPLMKEASSDAYAELLAEEMKARGALTSTRTPRSFEYAKMEARIQAKLPQRVWQKVADQVPGLEYEHLPLPKQLARGSEIPAGWTPPKPLLPEQPVAAPAPHLSEPRPVPTGVRPVSSETAQRVKSMTPVSMADHQEAVSFGQKLRAELDAHLPDGLADAARAYRDIRSRAPNLEEWERQWLHTGYTDRFPGIRARDVERDYAAAQRQVTLDMLKQTRGTADSARLAIESSVPEHDEIVAGYLRQAVENVPRDWVEQSNAAGDLYSIRDRSRALGQTGGYFQPLENGRGTLAVRYTQKDSIEALQTTALHEFVHRMEQVNPLISFLEQDFYEARTAGEALVDLTNGVNDQTKLDKWVDEYLGRKPSAINGTYNGRGWLPGRYVKYSYEILTMGVEMLLGPAGDAALLAQDPEWLHFVLAVLFGV
jgi:SPP1 gp7 family putative phage head morphogenesis protein